MSSPSADGRYVILVEEVEAAGERLNNNTNPRIDCVTSEMIENSVEIVIKELHELCNKV